MVSVFEVSVLENKTINQRRFRYIATIFKINFQMKRSENCLFWCYCVCEFLVLYKINYWLNKFIS